MRVNYTTWLVVVLLAGLLWPAVSYATHVRAGEITTRRLPGTSLTYEITFTAYFDEANGKDAANQTNDVPMCFGDGSTARVPRLSRTYINNNTSSIDIYRVTHTYPGPNAYTITANISNRNGNTRNLGGASSQNIIFSVSTTISANAGLGLNSTPVMLNPPLDSARVGQKFCHNPAAFDADGDSLAYRLSVPHTVANENNCTGLNINVYQDPTRFSTTTETGAAPPTYTVNALTGDVCWDAPGQEGQYNIAFIIEEWRNGVLIGEITRDMQIVVVNNQNRRPQLQVPPDLCVQAGTLVNQTIQATDPDGNRVTLSAYGGVFNRQPDNTAYNPAIVAQPYAVFTPSGTIQNQPATGLFSWQTACAHIRQEPYEVVLKVVDNPPRPTTQLATFATFRITVYGPAPQNLTARPTTSATTTSATTASGRAIQLSWTPYTCAPAAVGSDTTQIIIYRKEGCDNALIPACTTGIPAGYTEVGRVTSPRASFLDTGELRRGVSYSYRIVAQYPLPGGGVSVASTQVCVSLPLLAPLLTNVTVDSTGTTNGVITVRWTRPLGLRAGDLRGPYQYRLFRSVGQGGTGASTLVLTRATTLGANADTVFTDRGLNTVANAYTYRLAFDYTDSTTQALTQLDVTDSASSVRLGAVGATRQVVLSWQALTPWSNDNQTHRVYRSVRGPAGPFNQIAEVAVGSAPYSFTDTGSDTYTADGNTSLSLSVDSSYCYRVETVGRYVDGQIPLGLLYNYSQIVCASPVDTTRPCVPVLGLDSVVCASLSPQSLCGQTSFTNQLRWQVSASCAGGIASYNIYASAYEQDPSATRLTSVPAPTQAYADADRSSYAGCYYVTAVSRGGVESAASNRVCSENCPYYALPNVFTPNGDGKNDVFGPLSCPRFVRSVDFVVYNRWGAKVFETQDVDINWSGRTSGGQLLAGGLYYYQATVRFLSVDRNAGPVVYKGWVELIREGGIGMK